MLSPELQVLVVADEPARLQQLCETLVAVGFSIRQTAALGDALRQIDEECPDILLIDSQQSQAEVFDLCRKVRSLPTDKYIYQVIIAAAGPAEEVIKGLEAGADEYLLRPVCPQQLLARLSSGVRIITHQRWLTEIARNDSLTGLNTKSTFDEILQQEWSRSRRHDLTLSCVILDIDFFKQINDRHGHAAGDEVLKRVAETLIANSRVSDVLCRYGGEEFLALLPQTDEENASLWAERQREHLATQVFEVRGKQVNITCSFGVAEANPESRSEADLVEAADQALLFAKKSGRNRVVSHSVMHANSQNADARLQADPLQGVQARDIMTSLFVAFSPDETIGQAASHFLRSRTNSAPVVENGHLVGLLSEKDLVNVMLSPGAWDAPIRRHMKTSVACYDESTPISVIFEFLSRVSIRQVVILSRGRPTGIASRECLVRWFTSWAEAHSHPSESSNSVQPAISNWIAQLSQLASEITDRASQLQRDVHVESPDLIPKLVSGASQIEAALSDLLSYSRFANEQLLSSCEDDC